MQCGLIDFEGNIIKEDVLNKKNIKESYYNSYEVEKLYANYENCFGCSFSLKNYKKTIGEIIPNSEELEIYKIVDLGLSVKWAGWNVGAQSPAEDGICCGWADPTGKDQSGKALKKMGRKEFVTPKWKSTSSYGGENPPQNISGTALDIATQQWGEGWRLPTKDEVEELLRKCKWERVTFKGSEGYLITGPSGNRIFMKDLRYWTGEINIKTGDVYVLEHLLDKLECTNRFDRCGGSGHWVDPRPSVRAVYDKKK